MIPGDPQIRAQINTTHFYVNSVVDSGTLLETASKGNCIVTLKSYRYVLKEKAGFAWVAWDGRQALTNIPQKIRTILVYRAQGFDSHGNKIVSLPHSSLFWNFSEWGLLRGSTTDGRCHRQVWHCQCVWDCDVPGHRFAALPRNQRASASTRLSLPSRVNPLGSFCEGIWAFGSAR